LKVDKVEHWQDSRTRIFNKFLRRKIFKKQ